MLTSCLPGCRCQQDACCQKIRNAENQIVIPNTSLQPLTQAQTIYATDTNDLAEASSVSLCLLFSLEAFSQSYNFKKLVSLDHKKVDSCEVSWLL